MVVTPVVRAREEVARRDAARLLLFGLALVAAAVSVKLVEESLAPGGHLGGADHAILRALAARRLGFVTRALSDLTALGSTTVIVVATVGACVGLSIANDRRGVLHLALAVIGASTLAAFAKASFARARPEELLQIVRATGYSYPSGHATSAAAVYLTMAIVIGRHATTRRARVAIAASAALLVFAIGASRIYLGVHWPSDVVGGVLLGSGWACALDGTMRLVRLHRLEGPAPRASHA